MFVSHAQLWGILWKEKGNMCRENILSAGLLHILHLIYMPVCDEIPVAITACTAEQSFGNISECESHKTDRHTAREDTMTMKPPQDTFQTFHFKTQRDRLRSAS